MDRQTPPDPPTGPEQGKPDWKPFVAIAVTIALIFFMFQVFSPSPPAYAISYSEFKKLVKGGNVESVVLQGREIEGRLAKPRPIGPQNESTTQFSTRVPEFGDNALLPLLDTNNVQVEVRKPAGGGWTTVLVSFLPWLLLILFFFWLLRRTSQAVSGGQFGPGSELRRFTERASKRAEVPDVRFGDVAGQENAKREVTELVDYLRDPDQFRRLGAEPPRGVLLMGPPGTGKTLLARALAGEANVPFFSISASEFIEVFVGVGASRVRNLFEEAKKNSPSIIFVDELDSVGRVRGAGLGGGHDEREQTLNQILAEMDGFEPHEAVIVLAATNRPDVLDPALLRPGRFDRHVTLDLPDLNDRVAILRVHAKQVPLANDVDLLKLASGSSGFSGADLKNLVNEAAIQAARQKRDYVAMRDFDEARDKLLLGTVRKLAIQPSEHHRLAVHEAGHTIVGYYLPHTDPLYKVSIIPRGRALGGTQQLPEEERYTLPEEYLRDRLAVMLGGRVAERQLLGSVSSGADDDIRQATNLARSMVGRWGMSEDIGPMDLRETEEHPFLGRDVARQRHFSEHSAEAVDRAVHGLLVDAEARATDLVRRNRGNLDRLVSSLEKQETLERRQIEEILGPVLHKKEPHAPVGADLPNPTPNPEPI